MPSTTEYDFKSQEAELLDLYAYGKFDIGGRGLFVRAGNQVVSWGESTFIQNGINVLNPVDVGKLRAPGAELKEALSPTPDAVGHAGGHRRVVGRGDVDGEVGRAISGHEVDRPRGTLLQHQ